MQGIFILGQRPKSKKALREVIAAGLVGGRSPRIEATSFFGNEYDGPLALAPPGRIDFVGPNPYTDRQFYGQIVVTGEPGAPDRKYVVT